MYRVQRLFFGVLVLVLTTVTRVPVHAASEAGSEVPVAITAFDQATLEAAASAAPQDPPWRPVVASEGSPPSGLGIASVGAATFGLRSPDFFGLESIEVLRGPQGTLFEGERLSLANDAVAPFYETNDVATVVVAEVTGWPEDPLEAIYELALAFKWAGEETLDKSPFPGDPLLRYANVSSFGWFGGSPLRNYAKIQSGTWTQFADPLLRAQATMDDGRIFVSWLLPGLPELIAVNLSYSPDSTIESMIAQHVAVPIPAEIAEYPLAADFDTIAVDVQLVYDDMFAPVADSTTVAEEPGDATGEGSGATENPPPVEDQPERGDGADSGSPPVVADPAAGPTPSPDDGLVSATGEQSEGGGLPFPLLVLIPAFGAILIWFAYKWFFGDGATDSRDDDETPDPVLDFGPSASLLPRVLESHAAFYEKLHRDGGMVTDDGWCAPTFGQAVLPGEEPEGDPSAWTGYFFNVETAEKAYRDDPRYGDLLDKFGIAPPIDAASTVTGGVLEQTSDPDSGELGAPTDPSAADHGEAAIRSHPGPAQFLTAREEAIGLAEAMVGIVVDGWHRLPWESGSDFHIGSDGKTHRTIPVAKVEVSTDVELLGEPDGFVPDESRFAYWLHEDGTLKVGSPDDPHAYIAEQPPTPSVPLEEMLPVPGAGQSLMDVADVRLTKAHELTGGKPPVDGWIAPSNQAQGAALLSDAFSKPSLDPAAWSGHFFNTETGKWANAGDPQYRELMRRLGVTPKAKPVEETEPIGMDDGVVPD